MDAVGTGKGCFDKDEEFYAEGPDVLAVLSKDTLHPVFLILDLFEQVRVVLVDVFWPVIQTVIDCFPKGRYEIVVQC